MEYKVLYRKYRPNNFDSVSGQDYTIKILKKAVQTDKISHAYLFTGPRGTGKTSTAKIFAKAINCLNLKNGNPCGECDCCLNTNNNPDIIELDAASNNGVDEIRNIIESVRIAPSFSKYKVYIIDEVHMLTQSAFNALLLTLEEPPGNVVFILATTDVQKVPITILSRCQRFDFKPIDNESIYNRLKFVSDEEKIKVDDDALREIAYISNGGLRDALSILDQLAGSEDKITLEDVYSNFGTVSSVKIKKLVEYFVEGNTKEIIDILAEFKNNGTNYVVLIEKIIEELREVAIDIKCNNRESYSFDDIYDLIVELNNCLNNSNINLNPYVLIELTVLKYINRTDNMILYDFDNKKQEKSTENISREINKTENISREIKNNDNESTNISREMNSNENDNKNISWEINKEEADNKNISQEINNDEIESKNINFNEELIDIRVNNCFVSASKDEKNKIIDLWPEFLEYIDENFKSITSIMSDTSIAMASNEYIVLVTKKLSTADMVNSKINVVGDIFKELYDQEYKFICLSEDKWNEEMDIFKKNKKDGIKYEMKDEKDVSIEKIEDNIDSLANDLFGADVVEYE